jgi:HAD superfamily hydrolase (TIGR01490 family)
LAEVIAVFDMHGTLCRRFRWTWPEIVKWRLRRGDGIGKVITRIMPQVIMVQLLAVPLYRVRLISLRRMRMVMIKGMASLFRGLEDEELNQLAELFSKMSIAELRPDIQTIFQDHKQQGYRVVLLSEALQPFLEALGRMLSVDLSIGTQLEKKGSRYTGRLSSPICFNEQKAFLLRKHLSEASLEVDFSRSYAYGDTIWDKPVLEIVGNPVAVYPDAKLRAHAQEQGWRIIG